VSLARDADADCSPFGTGNETFGLDPTYKQLAAILSDAAFQANRRWFLEQSTAYGLDKTWSYAFNSAPPSAAPRLGAYHGADIPYVFGLPLLQGLNVSTAASALASSYNFTQADAVLSAEVIDYWYVTTTGGSTDIAGSTLPTIPTPTGTTRPTRRTGQRTEATRT
jgi:carboxylesterase type B